MEKVKRNKRKDKVQKTFASTFKENKAITLIALVITIIVLLILAGVAISAISGNENTMEKAQEAREKDKQGTELDAIKLAVVNSVASGLDGLVNADNLKEGLNGLVEDEGRLRITNNNAPWQVIGKITKIKYEIDSNGIVSVKSGISLNTTTINLSDEQVTYTLTATLSADLNGLIEWSLADSTVEGNTASNSVVSITPLEGNSITVTKVGVGGSTTITASLAGTSYSKTCTVQIISPTDIYVSLDGDTLRFYRQKENVSGSLYTNGNGEPINLKNINYTNYASVPWGSKTNIEHVSFEEEISAKSTQNWFWNLSNLIDIQNIENLHTELLTNMNNMFYRCMKLEEINVSKFDTSNVTSMEGVFAYCSGLKQLDISNWNTSNVTNMKDLFSHCSGLINLDVSSFDTSNVTNMYGLFDYCTKLKELDLSNWNTSKVTDMDDMFEHCEKITAIYVSDLWNTDIVSKSTSMFNGCNNCLVGEQGTVYYYSRKDKTYAKVDGGSSNPGYLIHINNKEKMKDTFIDLGMDVNGSGLTTDDWVLLYDGSDSQDTTIGGKIYCILADYLPNNNSAVVDSGLIAVQDKKYSVISNSDANLLRSFAHSTAWKTLISNNINSIEGVTVKGALKWDEITKIKENRFRKLPYLAQSNTDYDIHGCSGYWSSTMNASRNYVNFTTWTGSGAQSDCTNRMDVGVLPVVIIPSSAVTLEKNNDVWQVRTK